MTLRIAVRRKVFPAQGDASARLVFDDLALHIAKGEVCALVGPSGVGKTTLMQIAAGLDRAFEGTVTGRPERIGYLFQAPRLLPWRTVQENLALVLPGQPDAVADWLGKVGLHDAADVYPQRLSLGMARRVALARALAVQPQLLLLDEPFAALDESTAGHMQDLVSAEIARLGPMTLLVTHHGKEAAALADRILTLHGSPARIVNDLPVAGTRADE